MSADPETVSIKSNSQSVQNMKMNNGLAPNQVAPTSNTNIRNAVSNTANGIDNAGDQQPPQQQLQLQQQYQQQQQQQYQQQMANAPYVPLRKQVIEKRSGLQTDSRADCYSPDYVLQGPPQVIRRAGIESKRPLYTGKSSLAHQLQQQPPPMNNNMVHSNTCENGRCINPSEPNHQNQMGNNQQQQQVQPPAIANINPAEPVEHTHMDASGGHMNAINNIYKEICPNCAATFLCSVAHPQEDRAILNHMNHAYQAQLQQQQQQMMQQQQQQHQQQCPEHQQYPQN